MLGLRWMCMHLWMNLIKRTIDIQEKLKIVKIYVQSQWRAVLLWYHTFWHSSIQRGQHTQLCIITSLKWIIQICSNFYYWVCKVAFYSPNPHCCLGETSPLNCHSTLFTGLFYLPMITEFTAEGSISGVSPLYVFLQHRGRRASHVTERTLIVVHWGWNINYNSNNVFLQ